MNRKVLVVACHPDDEILGCGGTMARHVLEGDEVHVAILAEGITSRDRERDRARRTDELSVLGQAATDANRILGVAHLELLDFPDNRMDSCPFADVVDAVWSLIGRVKPDVVYTHHVGDLNIDHRVAHDAVVAACGPFGSTSVRELYFFEVASSTEWNAAATLVPFVPNVFVEISSTLRQKLAALSAYAGEMREFPHARSITALDHLAGWRGANVGVPAAEAFMLGRKLQDL